jgi:transcriptional regulator with XRE-family HTH domain
MQTLRELRTAKGWTLKELADEVGVSEMTAARWEWDTTRTGFPPAMPTRKLLARLFDVQADEIAFNTEHATGSDDSGK